MVIKDFLIKYRDTPWSRGQHDCIMFVWKYTHEVHAKPFANPDDYPFHDLKSARRACARLCKNNQVRSVEELFDTIYHREPLPFDGCIVAKPDAEGLTGYTYGVCYDGFGYFVDSLGLVPLELNPLTDHYWSID